jgi:hypothetical protein
MPTEPKLCRSGSGLMAAKGTYAPGGDAKYKSGLIKRVLDGNPSKQEKAESEEYLKQLGYSEDHIRDYDFRTITAARATAILEELGWTKFLESKVATETAKAERAEARELAKLEREDEKARKAEARAIAKAEKEAENAEAEQDTSTKAGRRAMAKAG